MAWQQDSYLEERESVNGLDFEAKGTRNHSTQASDIYFVLEWILTVIRLHYSEASHFPEGSIVFSWEIAGAMRLWYNVAKILSWELQKVEDSMLQTK